VFSAVPLAVGVLGGGDTVRGMLEFGLTGGIGSGKSTVSALLAERGAVVIDADAIVRDLQRPGELVFDAMIDRWGVGAVADDGTLNRAAVAEIVFSDAAELDALNGIVHPAVAAETFRRIDEVNDGAIVVHDIPLLVLPGGELLTSRDHTSWAGIVVVDTPEETATDRVVSSRGMDPDDVRARMAAQASRDDRRSAAAFVIDNSGDLDALELEVDRCWQWMTGLKESSPL
jgi:dephospho-CoA kinase